MSDDVAFALERSFLSTEFLTWLWFRCEVDGGAFEVHEADVSLAIEDGLSLTSWEDDELKASLRGGNPTRRPEAANALGSGLLLQKARFILAKSTREWLFTLDANTLDVTGIKVIDPEDDEEPEDALADKLAAGEELREVVDGLFEQFLGVRLDAGWKAEERRIRKWVKDKLTQAAKLVA